MSKKNEQFPKINKAVQENTELYNEIISGQKSIVEALPPLKDVQYKAKGESSVAVVHQSINDSMMLSVEGSLDVINKYKIKLFDNAFMSAPCLRFDSFGRVHINFNDRPLNDRAIPTPHFHKFNEKGIEEAFQTSYIKQMESEVLANRDLGLNHFLNIANISASLDLNVIHESLLQPEIISDDILKGVNFDE